MLRSDTKKKLLTFTFVSYFSLMLIFANGITIPQTLSFVENGNDSYLGLQMQKAYAENQNDPNISTVVGQTVRGSNYNDTLLLNGSHLWTSQPPRLSEWNGSYNQPYFIYNNTESKSITIATGQGSYVYDEIGCDVKFYQPTQNPNSTTTIVNSISYYAQYADDLNSTWSSSSLNNVSCKTTTYYNGTTFTITATRTNSDGTWIINYVEPADQPMESSSNFLNNGTTHTYIITETQDGIPISVPLSFIEDNGTKSFVNGTTYFGNNAKTLSQIFYKFGITGAYYSYGRSQNNLYKISYLIHADNTKQIVNNFISLTPLTRGQSFFIDPTFGYNTATGVIQLHGDSNTGSTCTGVSPTISSSTFNPFIPKSTSTSSCGYPLDYFDISSIPSHVIPSSINYNYSPTIGSAPRTCNLISILDNPTTASASTLWNDVVSNVAYITGNTACSTGGSSGNLSLGLQAITDFQTEWTHGYFTVGVLPSSTNRDSSDHYNVWNSGSDKLQIVYNSPPNAPTGLTPSYVSGCKIGLSWTASTPNNSDPVTGYEIDQSTDGNTWSIYNSNTGSTSTSYTTSALSCGQYYKWRVDGIATSAVSPPSHVVTSNTTPDVPTSVLATTNSSSQINMTWTAPSNEVVTSYEIDRESPVGGGFTIDSGIISLPTNYFTFDNTLVDQVGNATGKMISGSASYISGQNNKALSFTGSDYLNETNSTFPSGTGDKSISLWVKPSSLSDSPYVIGWGTSSTATLLAVQINTAGQISVIGSSDDHTFSSSALHTGDWSHLVVVISNTATNETLYVNGTYAGSATPTFTLNTQASPLIMGTNPISAGSNDLNGAIDDVKIYNFALTSTQAKKSWGESRTNPFFFDTGLTANTQYNYEIKSSNWASVGSASSASYTTTALSAPTGLALTVLSSSSIKLAWTAPSGTVTGYKIQDSLDNSTWSIVNSNTGNSTVTYTTTGLTSGTHYFFRVNAINSFGTSSPSHTADNWTLDAQPTSLSVLAVSTSELDLSWGAPTGTVTGYKVERSPDNSTWSTIDTNTGNTTTTYHDVGLTSATHYFYRVSGIDAGGTGSPSHTADNWTLPNVPTSLSATTLSTSSIQISWSAPSGTITGYKIERQSPLGGSWNILVSNTGSSSTSYTDTGLTSNTVYAYRVSAIDGGGTGSPSNVASSWTWGVPASITTLTIKSASTSKINLQWVAPSSNGSAISGYRIDRESPVGGGFSTIVSNTGNTNIYYNNTGISSNTQYNYRVEAINGFGTGATTGNQANAYTFPNAPSSLNANAVSTSQIDITWSAPSGAGTRGYEILRSLDNVTYTIDVANTTNTLTNYNDTGLGSGTKYYYRVVTLNRDASSVQSNTAFATTFTDPTQPYNLTAIPYSDTVINLSWFAPNDTGGTGLLGYKIERSLNNGTAWSTLVNNTGTLSTTYSDTGLTQKTWYDYRVSAWNHVHVSAPSNPALAVTYILTHGKFLANYTVVGDTMKIQPLINLTYGYPLPLLTQVSIYVNGSLVNQTSFSQHLNLNTQYMFTNNQFYKIRHSTNVTADFNIGNASWISTVMQKNPTVNEAFNPSYQFSNNGLFVYNATWARTTNYANLGLNVTRNSTSFSLQCGFYYSNGLGQTEVTWINQSNIGYYKVSPPVNPNGIVYTFCYDPDQPVFNFTSIGQNGFNMNGTITLVQGQFGNFFGAPMISAILLLFAGLWTGKNANTGLIIVAIAISIFSAVGLIVISQLEWGLVMVCVTLGVLLGRKFS